jgi:hypothetical protein
MGNVFKINDNDRMLLSKFMDLTSEKGLTWNNYIYGNKASVTCKNGKIIFDIGRDYPAVSPKDLLNLLI